MGTTFTRKLRPIRRTVWKNFFPAARCMMLLVLVAIKSSTERATYYANRHNHHHCHNAIRSCLLHDRYCHYYHITKPHPASMILTVYVCWRISTQSFGSELTTADGEVTIRNARAMVWYYGAPTSSFVLSLDMLFGQRKIPSRKDGAPLR